MKRYLQAILLFDVALPALFIGLPCFALLWAVLRFQSFVERKSGSTCRLRDSEPAGDDTQRGTGPDASEGLAAEGAIVK